MSQEDNSLANMILYSSEAGESKRTTMSRKLKEFASKHKELDLSVGANQHLFKKEYDDQIIGHASLTKRLEEANDLLVFPYNEFNKLHPWLKKEITSRMATEMSNTQNYNMSHSKFDELFYELFKNQDEPAVMYCLHHGTGRRKMIYCRMDGKDEYFDSLSEPAFKRAKKQIDSLLLKMYYINGKKTIIKEHQGGYCEPTYEGEDTPAQPNTGADRG